MKETETIKKVKYETPAVINLGEMEKGTGMACNATGPTATEGCTGNGTSAGGSCTSYGAGF